MKPSRIGILALAVTLTWGCDAGRRSDRGVPDAGPADLRDAQRGDDDLAGADLEQASCAPCLVTRPGSFCGLSIGIAPFVAGGAFGGFQSDVGSGESHKITITLSAPLRWVEVKILDPDFDGNKMDTFDASGAFVSTVDFPSDSMPGVLTGEFRGASGQLIQRVELVPAPADYVAYTDLRVIPAGCNPPVL